MKPFNELNPDRLQPIGALATDSCSELPGASVGTQWQKEDPLLWVFEETAIYRDALFLDSSIDDDDDGDDEEWLQEEGDGEDYMDGIILDEEDTDEEDDWEEWDDVEGEADGDGDLLDDLHSLLKE